MRGRGVAPKMLSMLLQHESLQGLAGSLVLPTAEAGRSLDKSGWKPLGDIYRYVTPLFYRTGTADQHGSLLSRVKYNTISLMAMMMRRSSRDLRCVKYTNIEKILKAVQIVWDKFLRNEIVIGVRDSNYFSWRFIEHPVFKYQICIIEQNEVVSGYIVYYLKDSICHVVDYLIAESEDRIINYLSCFANWMYSESPVNGVSIRGNSGALQAQPGYSNGWIRRHDRQLIMINMGSMNLGDRMVGDERRWYMTSADKDV
jgi:hypothetical protein